MRRVLLACFVTLACGSAATAYGAARVAPAAVPESAQHQLLPAYFYPAGSDASNPWHIMCRAMTPYSMAILNPDSGPGPSQNPPYVAAVSYCHARHQRIIGYISTDYATRSINAVLNEVDEYYRWYPMDGIFLDEMSNFPSHSAANGLTVHSYYQRIYNYVKGRSGPGHYLVGNPGAPAATPWQLTTPVADKIVVFEDTASLYLQRRPPTWVLHQPSGKIAALVKRTSSADRHRVCLLTRSRNTGWLDVTNDGPPNSWDTLPPYWSNVAPRCT